MQTSSRLGRTTIATTSKSAGKPVITFSSAGKHHQHKSHVSQRIWGMVSEASKINVDLQGLAESAKKRLQEHQEQQLSEKKKINNSAVKALRLDVVNGEDSGQKPKPAGTPSKRRVLQPVPFNAQ